MKEYIRTADRDGYRSKRELYEDLKRHLNMKQEHTTIEDMLHFWFSEFPKCTELMEGAQDVIEHLKSKQIKLGIITNGAVHTQHAKIDQAGIRPYFDCIVVSDEVGVKKPDRQIFDIALERLNIHPQQTWYVGDHPRNDVHGAREAGLQAVWLEGFMEWDAAIEPPEYVITHLKQLQSYFK
ncbi:HAD family hydrolase [Marinicrinis lubricantis]|uniref:HAD family hydrolase n=1 Tax=Marinicrinis lubricantis TaxID=2086470 RepID=A0ABW1IQV2_9BACL